MKSCSNNSDRSFVSPGVIIHRTEDDARLFSCKLLNILSRIGSIHQGDVTGYIDDHVRCTCNRGLKQRTCNSLFYCFQCLVVAASLSDTDMCNSLVCHDSLYVCKVQVDQRRYIDQVGNTLDTLLKHFVSLLKRLRHGGTSVYNFQKLIIRDNNQGVNAFF